VVFLVFLSVFDLLRVFRSFGLKKNEGLWLFEDFCFFEENGDFFLSQFPAFSSSELMGNL